MICGGLAWRTFHKQVTKTMLPKPFPRLHTIGTLIERFTEGVPSSAVYVTQSEPASARFSKCIFNNLQHESPPDLPPLGEPGRLPARDAQSHQFAKASSPVASSRRSPGSHRQLATEAWPGTSSTPNRLRRLWHDLQTVTVCQRCLNAYL